MGATPSASKLYWQYMARCDADDVLGSASLNASAEGRVENQKLNQASPYKVFWTGNRVEHQKLHQTTPFGAVWLSF